jgi:hypothetical protein
MVLVKGMKPKTRSFGRELVKERVREGRRELVELVRGTIL